MKAPSDVRVWTFIVLTAIAVGALCAGFLWYLESVGSADGPGEGMAVDVRQMGMVG